MNEMWHDTETWALLLGAVTPLAVAVVQQPHWPQPVRWAVGWISALVVGVLTCLANGDLGNDGTVLRSLVLVVLASQAAYQGWKKSGFVPAIEHATSPRSSRDRL